MGRDRNKGVDVRNALLAVLALSLSSCVAVVKAPPQDNNPPPKQQPVRQNPPPPPQKSPWPDGAPPVPAGEPWYHDKLELKYDAALEDCYNTSKKALVFMKFTEADVAKKTGELSAHAGQLYVNVTMYRKRHHTYLTFYWRVWGRKFDARAPGDLATRCHKWVGEHLPTPEEGRKTD